MYQMKTQLSNTQKKPFISFETLKLFAQGALGAMTFGMYHLYVTKDFHYCNVRNGASYLAELKLK